MTLKPDPNAYPPRGMSREQAAHYVGVGTTIFDELVAEKLMPKPRTVRSRVIWDRAELDIAFSQLPHQGQRNFFDRRAS